MASVSTTPTPLPWHQLARIAEVERQIEKRLKQLRTINNAEEFAQATEKLNHRYQLDSKLNEARAHLTAFHQHLLRIVFENGTKQQIKDALFLIENIKTLFAEINKLKHAMNKLENASDHVKNCDRGQRCRHCKRYKELHQSLTSRAKELEKNLIAILNYSTSSTLSTVEQVDSFLAIMQPQLDTLKAQLATLEKHNLQQPENPPPSLAPPLQANAPLSQGQLLLRLSEARSLLLQLHQGKLRGDINAVYARMAVAENPVQDPKPHKAFYESAQLKIAAADRIQQLQDCKAIYDFQKQFGFFNFLRLRDTRKLLKTYTSLLLKLNYLQEQYLARNNGTGMYELSLLECEEMLAQFRSEWYDLEIGVTRFEKAKALFSSYNSYARARAIVEEMGRKQASLSNIENAAAAQAFLPTYQTEHRILTDKIFDLQLRLLEKTSPLTSKEHQIFQTSLTNLESQLTTLTTWHTALSQHKDIGPLPPVTALRSVLCSLQPLNNALRKKSANKKLFNQAMAIATELALQKKVPLQNKADSTIPTSPEVNGLLNELTSHTSGDPLLAALDTIISTDNETLNADLCLLQELEESSNSSLSEGREKQRQAGVAAEMPKISDRREIPFKNLPSDETYLWVEDLTALTHQAMTAERTARQDTIPGSTKAPGWEPYPTRKKFTTENLAEFKAKRFVDERLLGIPPRVAKTTKHLFLGQKFTIEQYVGLLINIQQEIELRTKKLEEEKRVIMEINNSPEEKPEGEPIRAEERPEQAENLLAQKQKEEQEAQAQRKLTALHNTLQFNCQYLAYLLQNVPSIENDKFANTDAIRTLDGRFHQRLFAYLNQILPASPAEEEDLPMLQVVQQVDGRANALAPSPEREEPPMLQGVPVDSRENSPPPSLREHPLITTIRDLLNQAAYASREALVSALVNLFTEIAQSRAAPTLRHPDINYQAITTSTPHIPVEIALAKPPIESALENADASGSAQKPISMPQYQLVFFPPKIHRRSALTKGKLDRWVLNPLEFLRTHYETIMKARAQRIGFLPRQFELVHHIKNEKILLLAQLIDHIKKTVDYENNLSNPSAYISIQMVKSCIENFQESYPRLTAGLFTSRTKRLLDKIIGELKKYERLDHEVDEVDTVWKYCQPSPPPPPSMAFPS